MKKIKKEKIQYTLNIPALLINAKQSRQFLHPINDQEIDLEKLFDSNSKELLGRI